MMLCLVFLVLAGNSFWCFVHMVLFVQYSCAVVSVFGSGWKSVLVLHTYVIRVKYNCFILKIRPKSYFREGRRMSAQRNFDTPPKNLGIFRVVTPRHGRTQRRIYDLFFVRGFLVCTTFVRP